MADKYHTFSFVYFRLTNVYGLQVAENVLDYQVDRHARTMGIDSERTSEEEKDSIRDYMIRENYPGNNMKEIKQL